MAAARSFRSIIEGLWARSVPLAKRLAKMSALAVAALLGGAPVARADWGFTHWGMTPEQVVGASGGTAHLVPPAARKRDDADNWEVAAEGVVRDGGLALDGGYMFDTNSHGLICVLYNASGDDVNKLRDGLIARYGQPRRDSEFGPLRTLTWQTPDKVELAINRTPPTAAVSHCTAPKGADGRPRIVR